ncbi:multi-sensor hybrid histidine kinase [Tolypothrix tenuis PCC 7101]|uniref:Circadian input-output histidine kinase CikA n=1 Tax=Tolypothrix tenuis PCC 7101 TaxID=231146 RepID=A0A1Z4NA34_9CYAN|nr:response regulator [Aulosira sp. FACHB-113]BAZ02599.1 multi-sensor hybrid histidine kinase [Tolypothrix tenuis PCC 7101]BAZ73480.1 multi-sensor hybrid histidine kinase [Aulosira laxa NIES-50]
MFNHLKIGSKIGASFALGLAILSAIGYVSYRTTQALITTSYWENHTYQVLGLLDEISSKVKDAETGQRGYIITGKEPYLEPYQAAIASLEQPLQKLRKLTADNPSQQSRLNILEPLVNERINVLKKVITARQNQGFEAAQKLVLVNEGKLLMDHIRSLTEEMKQYERELLTQRSIQAKTAAEQTTATIVYGIPISFILIALIGYMLSRNISQPLEKIARVAGKIADGDLSTTLPDTERQDEVGILTHSFNQMIANLRETKQLNEEQNWLKSNLADLSNSLQGRRNLANVTQLILSRLATLVGAQQGVFYVVDSVENQPVMKLLSSYAYNERKNLANQFHLGEGLVGQCALEKQRILLTQVPNDYIRISSGLGEAPPLNIIVLPVLFEDQVVAVIELASFQTFNQLHLTFLEQVTTVIGVVLNAIKSDMLTQELLQQSQDLTEELQHQQSELKLSNQRLQEQAQELEESQLLLKQQQEELQQSNEELQQLNEELEEKAELLETQKREVEVKNQQIEQARLSLEEKAKQLTLTSKYKSEFLANMSHELRTPLNSLLILARLMAENSQGNLTEKQIEYSQTIYSAGNDLLRLINDILDLAKIESGKFAIEREEVRFITLQSYLQGNFHQLALEKKLSFNIQVDGNLPLTFHTDSKRLQQILNNLLANSFKFTDKGGISLQISLVNADTVAFAVSDTGIGIPNDKQQLIFEAFQQADGTTSRKYGGTGLGLSISRELAHLLGGRIELVSQLGQGSTFTLYLPIQGVRSQGQSRGDTLQDKQKISLPPPIPAPAEASPPPAVPITPQTEVADDRDAIQAGDRVLLVIEDDVKFVRILLDMARQQGFKVLVALNSKQGLALAQQFKPDAITLDICMPDIDGWMVLDRLKHDSQTRHIPVHIFSIDDRQQRGLELGAIAYVQKPVTKEQLVGALTDIKGFVERKVKNLLVIEDDPVQARSIIELIGNGDVHSTAVHTAAAAIATLQSQHIDCIVLDLGLPDMTGLELIEEIKQQPNWLKIPIIVYTGKELSRQEETQLRRLAETIIIKDVRSPERLLDETALFLHRIQANLPQSKRHILEQLRNSDPILANKKILIIDDDVRNIFALTSLLEGYQMQVLFAENGRDGIATLQANSNIDIVLMDIMMPEMDGYQTTRAIRQLEEFRTLPIIALTAKAMQGDREKCIEAGASDYITKPVDTEQLLSLLRVWLYH